MTGTNRQLAPIFRLAAAAVVLGAVLMSPARGLGQEAGRDPVSLESVVVTTGMREEILREVPNNVTIIDSREIENSTSKELGSLLARHGLQVTSFPGGNISTVTVRGYKTDMNGEDLSGSVLILLNGHRIGTSNLTKLTTLNVERVEIIRGPAAVQYGAAAMGGVVNVITKRGSGKTGGSVQIGGGSYEALEAGGTLAGSNERLDFSLGYRFYTVGDFYTAKRERYAHTGTRNMNAANFDLGYKLAGAHRLGVNLNYHGTENSGRPDNIAFGTYSMMDNGNYAVGLSYEGAAEGGLLSWKVNYNFGEDTEKWYYVPYDEHYWTKVKFRTVQAMLNLDHRLISLTSGLDMAIYDTDRDFYPTEDKYTDVAFYLIAKLRLLEDKLNLTAAARENFYKISLPDDPDAEISKNNLTMSFGLTYSPADFLKIRANYGEAFLLPNSSQLFSDYLAYGYHWIGDRNLKPQTSATVEGGFDIFFKEFDFHLTYFASKFKDAIVSEEISPGVMLAKNMARSERSGFELEAGYDVGWALDQDFSLRPYVGWTRMTTAEDTLTGERLNDIPRDILAFGLTFEHPGWDFSASLRGTYYGKEKTMDNLYVFDLVDHGNYTVVDLSLRKKIFDWNGGKVDLMLNVNNITNTYYESFINSPNPGRNFNVILKYLW
ncbi:MAG: TonB-dependent receptor [Deltaproteobacteria bacterium]|nr:TonB-dependent receptor [Deltaproteobacteria bacterium]